MAIGADSRIPAMHRQISDRKPCMTEVMTILLPFPLFSDGSAQQWSLARDYQQVF
jgi:hypothetical protein